MFTLRWQVHVSSFAHSSYTRTSTCGGELNSDLWTWKSLTKQSKSEAVLKIRRSTLSALLYTHIDDQTAYEAR